MSRTAADWTRILVAMGVAASVAGVWGPVFADTIKPGTFSKGDSELVDFLPEILHESGMLTRMVENLNYSPERMCAVWPTRFPSIQVARPYANNPQALANLVYGGRMGNTARDDGWLYRGRSPLQITGKSNYEWLGNLMGQDLTVNPDLLAEPHYGLEASIAWWENRIPDAMLGETTSIRRRVNGGTTGLAEVQALTERARKALNS